MAISALKPLTPTINLSHPDGKGVIFDILLTEGAGTMLRESVSKVFSSSVTGSPSWTKGLYGKHLVLNGSTGFGFPADFFQTVSTFTIISIIYPTVSNQIGAIFGSDRNGGIEFRLNANKLDLVKENVIDIGSSTATIPLNSWSVVAVTYDTSGNYTFYNNGAKIGNGTNLQTFTSFIPQVGYNNPTTNEFFNGNIALIREYNYVLTSSQINRIAMNPFAIYNQPTYRNTKNL